MFKSQLSILVSQRFLIKILDFVLNVLVVNQISKSHLGLVNHFDLYLNLSLYIVKQPLKQAYLRRDNANNLFNQVYHSAKNLMLFGVCIVAIITFLLSTIYFIMYSILDPSFRSVILLYNIAAIVEAFGEVFLVHSLLKLQYAVSATAEAFAGILKTIILYLYVTSGGEGLTGYGIGQVVYASIFMIVAWKGAGHNCIQPVKIEGQYIQQYMKDIGWGLSINSGFKLFLQEIEKIVLVYYYSSNPQVIAEYGVVSHLGGMLPRLLFSAVEEISFNIFAKSNTNHLPINAQLSHLNLCFIVLGGIPLCKDFLTIMFPKYNNDSTVLALQIFCVYELIMAINGITDVFVQANLSPSEITWFRKVVGCQSCFSIVCLIIFSGYEAPGLVLANCINMAFRIMFSLYIILKKVQNQWRFPIQSFFRIPFLIMIILGAIKTIFIQSESQIDSLKVVIIYGFANVLLIYSLIKGRTKEFMKLFEKN